MIETAQLKLAAALGLGRLAPGSASATRVFFMTLIHFRATHVQDWLLVAAFASIAIAWLNTFRAGNAAR